MKKVNPTDKILYPNTSLMTKVQILDGDILKWQTQNFVINKDPIFIPKDTSGAILIRMESKNGLSNYQMEDL
jgi:hypothetical protein